MNASYREDELNSLIYMHPLKMEPTRYEMVRYSTWRIYFYQELEAMPSEKTKDLRTCSSWVEKYPNLITNNQQKQFYSSLFLHKKDQVYKQDNISHFTSRMLYCYDSINHQKFIDMEREMLSIKLHRMIEKSSDGSKVYGMKLLKQLLGFFLKKNAEEFNVDTKIWEQYKSKILRKDPTLRNVETIEMFAVVDIEQGEVGLKKRMSFVKKGQVYLNIESTILLTLNLYTSFLKQKMQKMRVAVVDLINNDVENQMSGFIRKTLDTMNNSNFDEALVKNEHKLTMRNVEMLWKRVYPPCMMHLTEKLKQNHHLRHDGRRQLWLFLKGCGMTVQDNKEYFHKYFASKVSGSELKSHMYNIEHAYGLVGHKQQERPKNCRNIITGTAPKKDEHHGCPFSHWRNDDLREYLRKNYKISEQNLDEVMKEKNENHFQVACGRLFEGVSKANGLKHIPPEITNMLGRSPHQYFQAGMDLFNKEAGNNVGAGGEMKNLQF